MWEKVPVFWEASSWRGKGKTRKEREMGGKTVASILAYLIITLVLLIFFLIQLLIFVVTFPFDKTRYFVGRWFRLSAVLSTYLNPLFSFRVYGKITKIPEHTVICFFPSSSSTHIALLDNLIIFFSIFFMKKGILFSSFH